MENEISSRKYIAYALFLVLVSAFNLIEWVVFLSPLIADAFVKVLIYFNPAQKYGPFFMKAALTFISMFLVTYFIWYKDPALEENAAVVFPFSLIVYVIQIGLLLITMWEGWNRMLRKISMVSEMNQPTGQT